MTPENENNIPNDPDVPPEYLRPDDLNPADDVPSDYLPPAEPSIESPAEPPAESGGSFELPPIPEPSNPFELPPMPDETPDRTDFPAKPPTPVNTLPDVPPEYLGAPEGELAASELHPEPTTDIPAEYLSQELPIPEPAPAYRAEPPLPPVSAPSPAYPAEKKDRGVALILEILPGLFGFLGIGWIYTGNLTVGISALIGFWVLIAIEVFIVIITVGFGACCVLPLNIIILAASALMLNNYIQQHPDQFKN